MKKLVFILFLIILTSVSSLIGRSSIAPFDRDEARYLQASKQMLESNNFVDIHFQETNRLQQPAGIYWLESGSVWAASAISGTDLTQSVWAYRIPSFIAANIAVILTFIIGCIFLTTEASFLAAAVLSVTVLFVSEAHLATVDMSMMAIMLGMMLCLAKVYCRRDRDRSPTQAIALIFWALVGVEVMLKGPVACLVPFLTVFTLAFWDKDFSIFRKMGFIWGWVIAAIIVAPWIVVISYHTHGEFLNFALGHNLFGKMVGAQEAHGFWPGYYLLTVFLSFWPGILFLVLALPFVKDNLSPKALRLLVSWIVPTWVVLELIPTKLPHYILPLFPALCLLALSITNDNNSNPLSVVLSKKWMRFTYRSLFVATALFWILSSLILCTTGLFFLYVDDIDFSWIWIILEALIFILLVIGGVLSLAKEKEQLGVILVVLGALLADVICFGLIIPNLPEANFTTEVVSEYIQARPTPETKVASLGYREPSFVFLAGAGQKSSSNVVLSSTQQALDLANHECAIILADHTDIPALQDLAQEQNVALTAVKSVGGFNYSNGHEVALTFLANSRCLTPKTTTEE